MSDNFILNKFFNSKYFKEILSQYEVICVILGGSRGLECEVSSSDYDLFFFVKENVPSSQRNIINAYYFTENEVLHYTVFSFQNFIFDYKGNNSLLGLIEFSVKKKIVWKNSCYSTLINKIETTLNSVSFNELSSKAYANNLNEKIIEKLESKDIIFSNIAITEKDIYHLLVFCWTVYKYDNQKANNIRLMINKLRRNGLNTAIEKQIKNFLIDSYRKAMSIKMEEEELKEKVWEEFNNGKFS